MAENVDVSQLQKAVNDTLDGFGKVFVEAIQEVLQDKNKVVSGDLYNSIHYEVVTEGEQMRLQVYASDVMKFVENGRMPSTKMPNIQEIMRWIQFKGIKPRTIKGKGVNFKNNAFKKPLLNAYQSNKKIGVPRHKTSKGKKTNINAYKAQMKLAFLIAKAIQRDGIKAKKIIAPVIKVVTPHLEKELTDVFTKNYRDAIGNALKNAITVDSPHLKMDVNF